MQKAIPRECVKISWKEWQRKSIRLQAQRGSRKQEGPNSNTHLEIPELVMKKR